GPASPPSAALTPTAPPAPTVPDAPSGAGGTPGDGLVSVHSSPPASNGGAAITGYTVAATPGGATATTNGATSVDVTGLTDGTAYTFTVTATNSVGTGSASAPSAALTPTAPPPATPAAPSGVVASVAGGMSTVTWTPPVPNGTSAITSYTVTSNPGG